MRSPYLMLAIALLLAGRPAAAQQSSCLPANDDSVLLLSYAEELATSSDPRFVATRDHYGILPVPASEVELVTSNQTCKTAAREYKNSVGLTGKAPSVHVVRIGTRYIVMNPNTQIGEFTAHVVFDENFNELHKFAG